MSDGADDPQPGLLIHLKITTRTNNTVEENRISYLQMSVAKKTKVLKLCLTINLQMLREEIMIELDNHPIYEETTLSFNILHLIWQQDSAPPHYGLQVRDILNGHFEEWIGRLGKFDWPPRSPDLTPCDFSMTSYVTYEVVYCSEYSQGAGELGDSEERGRVNGEASHHIVAICDSRATEKHYIVKDWPPRESYVPGEQNIKEEFVSHLNVDKRETPVFCHPPFNMLAKPQHDLSSALKCASDVIQQLGTLRKNAYEEFHKIITMY
ncbi:hypothetical protein ANN_18780 [Periplaneta americana]|uniref:Uncharacterized protein n=1 Tax=Periplaneta americana TaxID=6978 RepID=A0ABQ8SPR3_PERAM|nr:hypothetical protein ANN_18780 [Periplaneta americana]